MRPLKPGQTLWIKFPTLDAQEIKVLWAEAFTAGCSFTRPLADCVLANILKMAGETAIEAADRRMFARA